MVDMTAMSVAVFVVVALTAVLCYSILIFFTMRSLWRIFAHNRITLSPPELCYVCCDSMSDVALLYCGHSGLCLTCARKVLAEDRRCPLCRSAIVGVMLPDA